MRRTRDDTNADRELRDLADTRLAIVTLGACQMRWQHCVPKVKRAGPRISCSLRWTNTTNTEPGRVSRRRPSS